MSGSRIFDVDIDTKPNLDKPLYGVRAMVYNEETEKIIAHPSGFYIEDVPVDQITGLAAIDYKYGDEKGFMKIDLLTNSSYESFQTKQEVLDAMETEPDWKSLEREEFVDQLPHLSGNFDIVSKVNPESIEDLADVLALIRPAKRHLIDSYVRDKKSTRVNLYRRASNDMAYFKRSHAISYALMIVCVMNSKDKSSMFGW